MPPRKRRLKRSAIISALTRPSPKYLLAMKCFAARLPMALRDGDTTDIKFLMSELRIKSMEQIDTIVRKFTHPCHLGTRVAAKRLPCRLPRTQSLHDRMRDSARVTTLTSARYEPDCIRSCRTASAAKESRRRSCSQRDNATAATPLKATYWNVLFGNSPAPAAELNLAQQRT